MTLFSQRKGIRPVSKAIQFESIDDELRNSLWNALKIALWDYWSSSDYTGFQRSEAKRVESIVRHIWAHYFKQTIDTMPGFASGSSKSAYAVIREYFFKSEWWQTYDLVEFIVKSVPSNWVEDLKQSINLSLEAENAAYRIVGDEIVEITDKTEIEEIESALEQSISTVEAHLSRALDLLSDRKSPDYRNSIKESISSVEATCKVIASLPSATLGDCIRTIKQKGALHPAFEQALLKLYGYTSDAGGIRHSLTEDSVSPSYADAKFMLVACSAFINFLWTKASELKIKVPK